VDVFVSYFRDAVGFAPEILTPESAALWVARTDPRDWSPCSYSPEVDAGRVSPLVGHDFMTWLWFQSEQHPDAVPAGAQGKVGVMLEGPLTLVMEGGGAHETVLRKGNPTVSSEAKACLLAGKKLRKATVNLVRGESVWRFALDGETLAFRSLKLVNPEGALDPVSRFQDRMLQLETLTELLLGVYGAFATERRDAKRWDKTLQAMRAWVEERHVVY